MIMPVPKSKIPIILSAVLILLPALLFAGEDTSAIKEKVVYPRKIDSAISEYTTTFKHEFESYARFMPASKVKHMPGKLEIVNSEAEYSLEVKLFGQLPIQFSIDQKYIGVDNTTSIDFPAHLLGLTFDVETTLPFFTFQNTYFRFGVSPSFYTDQWSYPTSAFRVPSRYFLIYQPDGKWTFIAGVAVYPDYKDEVGPILGFIYKPSEKLIFNIIPTRPTITYNLNDTVSIFAEGGFSSDEFEVTRNNIKGVVLMYDDAFAGGGLGLKLGKYVQASLSAGGVFGRSLKYRDKRGKANIKDGMYSEFRVDINI